jgi:hypothetical protein
MKDGTLVGQRNAKQAQSVVAVHEDGVMVGTPTAHCTTLFRLTFWGLERWRLIGVKSHSGTLAEWCPEAVARLAADSGMDANGRFGLEANGFALLRNGVRRNLRTCVWVPGRRSVSFLRSQMGGNT